MSININPKFTRRNFIKQSGLLSGGILLPFDIDHKRNIKRNGSGKPDQIYDLLKTYCDSMLRLQVTELKDPAVYGGVMCPLNVRVRGRV